MTTTYLGFDVLEMRPNATEAPSDSLSRRYTIMDPGTGPRYAAASDDAGTVGRSFLWTCTTKAEIAALKAWLDTRKGQAVPFWMPTWRADLLLASTIQAVDTAISVQPTGYTQFLWPYPSRRHVAIQPSGSVRYYRRITGATDLGTSETLNLSASLGVQVSTAALVSFLTLCRLATDEPELTYLTDSVAEARLPFIEIPAEVP